MSIGEYIIAWLSANAGKLIWLATVIVAAVIISKLVSRGLRTLLNRSQVPSASIFINLARVLIWVIAVTIVLQPVFGINPTTLITALGVGGVAISLGMKDTIANVIGGFGLMLGKVIQPGDLVTVAGTTGVVKDITWRHTVVKARSGDEIVIPNSVLNTSSLERVTEASEGCVTVPFTLKSGTDLESASMRMIATVGKATAEYAADGNPPLVKFTGFSPYGVEGEIMVFAKPGIFASTIRDAAVRSLAGEEFLEQRAATGE